MTGCVNTSALCRQGKKKAFNLVKHNPELQTLEEVLLDSSSTPDAVALAGEEILLALYGATSTMLSLNTHIPHCFMKTVATCPIQLGALPPTSAAAREHSWHVYHQVHSWLGNYPLPSDLGWDLVNGQLPPVISRLTPAPPNPISCNCKCGCERGCGCRMASCVLWYADSVVQLVVVILHNQMSLMENLTLTKMKIALIPRELSRKETFDAILVARRWKWTHYTGYTLEWIIHFILKGHATAWTQSVLVET